MGAVLHFWAMGANRKVFGHMALFDAAYTDLLQGVTEIGKSRIVVDFGAECEATRPGKNTGHRIG